MNLKQFYTGRAIGFVIVVAIVLCVFAVWKLHAPAASSDKYAADILACYPKDTGGTYLPIPNNSVQQVKETSRIFINMPKDLYPQDLKDAWTTVSGNATAGSIGGGFGESVAATPNCWSSYMDFEGSGEVDLRVKSVVPGAPDYFVRFIVSPLEPIVIDNTAVDPALLIRMQTDLQGFTPYFLDVRSYDGKPLTPQEAKIRDDVVDILVSKEPDNREYYSPLWPLAIGNRYVLVMQPSASSYYHILIDSQTGKSSFLQNAASYIPHPLPFERREPTVGRQTVLYIGYQDIYTYTLDEGTFVLVPGSKLSGSETYHNGRADFNLQPEETHDDNSIHISVFDSSQIVPNPYAQPNTVQTMSKKLRELDLTF